MAGEELGDVEMTHHALHAVAVLDWGAHFGGKRGGGPFRAGGAPLAFGAMFAHFHGDGRKIENLALFLTGDGLVAQVRVAVGAAIQGDGMDDVGGGALLKGLAGVAWLATGLVAGVFAPQGFDFALQAVAGGWFAAVGTIHGEALFEFCNTGFDGRNDRSNEFTYDIESTGIEGGLDSGTQGFGAVAQHRK